MIIYCVNMSTYQLSFCFASEFLSYLNKWLRYFLEFQQPPNSSQDSSLTPYAWQLVSNTPNIRNTQSDQII